MEVLNVHQRALPAEPDVVGALLDSLASAQDRLWPRICWPAMRLDRPLAPGAVGGHGPIRYVVDAYRPGQLVRFRFLGPRGFVGHHWLEVLPQGAGGTVLRHTIRMRPQGLARLTWPLAIRPLHDALLEDALARAEAAIGTMPQVRPWSRWVRLLRWVLSGGRAPGQATPQPSPAAPVPAPFPGRRASPLEHPHDDP